MNQNSPLSLLHSQPTTGVLTEDEVLLLDVVGGKRTLRSLLLPAEAYQLSGLLTFLWQSELTALWVMPATTLSRTITCSSLEQAQAHWNVVVHPAPHEPTRPSCALLWPREDRRSASRRLVLAFPEHAGWGWVLPDAKSLLATVTYLEQTVARPVIDAPELVAHQLLTESTGDQPTSQRSPLDLSRLPTSTSTPAILLERPRALAWMRPLTLAEQRARYLHQYTHLSLSLEAARSVQLGVGEPQYAATGGAYDGRRPGLWRVSAERVGSVFDGKRLPSCLEGEWMSTPQVQCCREIGYQVQVREGYFWQEARDLLNAWATTLWQAAERLQTQPHRFRHPQARANACRSMSRLADLGMAILAREQAAGGWNRPDWWTSLLGASRATLFAHLVRLVRKGTMPVLLVGDVLWVVSNDPNPLTAAPGLLTARRWQGYMIGYEAPLPLSRDVQQVFRSAQDAHQLARTLDTLAGEVFPAQAPLP